MLEERTPHRTGSLFGDLGERLARTFGGPDRTRRTLSQWDEVDALDDQETIAWEQTPPRFPVARHGYDCAVVDQHLEALERELDDLRAGSKQSVATEIEKIGQQTASILTAAHDQAHEITRAAQRQAEACVADAATNAVKITEDANRKLRQLDSETDAIWHERTRLIEDARNVATALFTLAEEAAERFPGDGDKPQPVASSVAPGPAVEEEMPSPLPASG